MVYRPLRGGVEIGDGEKLVELLEVRAPRQARRRRDEADGAAARHHGATAQPLDQMAVADEVDPLDPWPVGYPCAGEPH